MDSQINFKYPPLANALYNAHSIDEARSFYVSSLRKTGEIYNYLYASKLESSNKMLSTHNLKLLEQDYFEFKDHMRFWSKNTNIPLSIFRRQKDFLGLNSKIRLFLQTGKSMSKIHDLIGFRLVLSTPPEDNAETIKHCYEALNETIRFFAIKKNCMILEAEPRSGAIISPEGIKKMNLFVPEKALILPGFENNVKDYILYPKKKGYQSLHILVETPNDIIFEVQIRTSAMDIVAEHGNARHVIHKRVRYEDINLGDIDFSKINMPGFRLLPCGEIYDTIGLQKSIDPFNFLY